MNTAPPAERLEALIESLDGKVKKRVQARSGIEQRWLEDLRAYYGQYSPDELKEFKDKKGSEIFINLLGPKTDAVIAKLEDLLFPTDETNWNIKPTPIPELSEATKQHAILKDQEQQRRDELAEQAVAEENPGLAAQALQSENNVSELEQKLKELELFKEDADKRCERMKTEISDQFKACSYQAESRDLLEQGAKLGTGVLKGPVVNDRATWRYIQGEGGFKLTNVSENRPAVRWVDVWNFFPGPVGKVGDSEGFFERHLLNRQQIRKFKDVPGFDNDGLRKLLREDPKESIPSYLSEIKALGENPTASPEDKLYHVYEYNGPIEGEDLVTLMEAMPQEDDEDLLEELDELAEIHVVVWFSNGILLKYELHPLDTGEPIYSVFNPKKVDGSLFGYGIPRMLLMAQDMLNSGVRMMMDNAGKTVGPQIVIDKTRIAPQDGDWTLCPFKIWETKDGIPKDEEIFKMFHIDGHQAELANIMGIAKQNIDEESGLPKLAQGEQGSGVTKTFNGMALLINATNVVFKRMARNYDDDVAVPIVRRQYHWNMQFSDSEAIKGDYEVDAIGSSVLLVREIQAQNLLSAAEKFGGHPIYGPIIKPREMLTEAFKSMSLPISVCLKTEDELEEEIKKQKSEPPPKSPEIALKEKEIALEEYKLQMAQAESEAGAFEKERQRQFEIQKALLDRETQMLILSEKTGVELAKIRSSSEQAVQDIMAKLQDSREERQHQKEQLNSEFQAAVVTGQSGGGYV